MKRLMCLFLVTVLFVCGTNSSGLAQMDTGILLDKMIEVRGGAEKMGQIKTSVAKGHTIMVAQGGVTGDISATSIYPDRTLIEISIVGVVIAQGFDGKVAWIDNPLAGGYQELPPAETETMRRDAVGYDALLNPEKHGFEYHYAGTDSVSGKQYYLLERIYRGGTKTTMYIDAESYLVYKTEVNKGSPVQPYVEETFFSDYRDVNGVTEAYQMSVFVNGQEISKYLFDEITFNAEVDPAVFEAAEKRFTRAELITDTRQLAAIIEETHPDPYKHIGGKIAFHRHFQQVLHAIPDDGMTMTEFTTLLRPFVAAINDGHTEVYVHHNVNLAEPGGIPLRFNVVEQSLYVSAVPGKKYREYLGATLVSVEDVSIEELGRRLRHIKPIDNQYHLLWYFTTNYLRYRPYLQELLPEWVDVSRLRVKLRHRSGEVSEIVFDLPMNATLMMGPESRVSLFSTDESGFAYGFLGADSSIAYLRIDHMKYYRESYETRNSLGIEAISQEKLDSVPSVTELFRSMVTDLKDSGTQTIIVDLRRNVGGDALMADILMYFLYGRSATVRSRWSNVNRFSSMYLDSRTSFSLEEVNEGRDIPWVEGDYDFSQDYTDKILSGDGEPELDFWLTPSFYTEWESGGYEGYYCPENVVVLTSPGTFSAGFGIAVRLYRMGAILVGTPSGQAPNSGGNAAQWTLNNTGVTGRVSQSYVLNFPDDSQLSRVLPVHYPLSLDLLASYDFDPNAEVLYALDLLPKLRRESK